MVEFLKRGEPICLSILRIIAALLFMEHGLMKLFHFPAAQAGVPDHLPTLLLCAALIEIVAGSLLVVGLFSRAAAFICSGQMAIGYFIAHLPKSFWPGVNGGDAAILFCFLFLYIVFAGPGKLSMDHVFRAA